MKNLETLRRANFSAAPGERPVGLLRHRSTKPIRFSLRTSRFGARVTPIGFAFPFYRIELSSTE
jgi:hypothetical protein